MAKKMIYVDIGTLSNDEIDGCRLSDVMIKLNGFKFKAEQLGVKNVQFSYTHEEFDIIGERLETDDEYSQRMEQDYQRKLKAEKLLAEQEMAEKAELARLISKWGIPENVTRS